MGWLSGQFIDIIEWMDDGQETMVCRFERHNILTQDQQMQI